MSKIDPHSLQGILMRINQSDRILIPECFKSDVLSAIQLYFDGLVESRDLNPEVIEERHTVLDALLKGVRLTVSGYYRNGKEIQYGQVQEEILQFESAILKYGSKKTAKPRHLSGCEIHVLRYLSDVERNLNAEKIDLIIPIASGGFEPAALVADCLNIDNLLPVRYSGIHRKDSYVRITEKISRIKQELIRDKKILIVDDIIDKGTTMDTVISWAKGYEPSETYFSAVRTYRGYPSFNGSYFLFRNENLQNI